VSVLGTGSATTRDLAVGEIEWRKLKTDFVEASRMG